MSFFKREELIENIKKKVDRISSDIDKMKIAEYVDMIEHPRKMLWANFLGGLARGFGMAVGFTLMGAIVLYSLRAIVKLHLPVIGQFIAEIVKLVQDSLEKYK